MFAVASLFPVINCSSLCASLLSAASPLFAVDTEGPPQAGAPSALFTEQILWLSKQPYPPPHGSNTPAFLCSLTDGCWSVQADLLRLAKYAESVRSPECRSQRKNSLHIPAQHFPNRPRFPPPTGPERASGSSPAETRCSAEILRLQSGWRRSCIQLCCAWFKLRPAARPTLSFNVCRFLVSSHLSHKLNLT